MISKFGKADAACAGWLNIYRLISAPFIVQTSLHATKDAAVKQAEYYDRIDNDHKYIATIYVEWSENDNAIGPAQPASD